MATPTPTAVYDTSETTFQDDVVAASEDATILVDFHADWCGPCKTLGPILERIAEESAGRLRLAKVDTEKERRLAAAFRVQSIPFVVAFQKGQPVDYFAGAKDESGVHAFLEKLGVDLSADVSQEDASLDTTLGKCEALLRGRRFDELERVGEMLRSIEEDEEDYVAAQRLLEACPFFASAWTSTGPAAEAATRAREAYASGDEASAMHALFESLQADRSWEEELARRALVAIMHLHPEHDDLISTMRRRLAVLLY